MKTIVSYLRLWKLLTVRSFEVSFVSRFGAALFLLGKIVRFGLFIGTLLVILAHTGTLGGYDRSHVLFVVFSFNVIDTTTQLLLREVYRFRDRVVSGDFDLILLKPSSALFRSLLGGADALDLLMLPPLALCLVISMGSLHPSLIQVGSYLLFLMLGFCVVVAFHIVVLSTGLLASEVDNLLSMYRDVSGMGKYPFGVYAKPLREFLTYAVPVGIIMAFPPTAFFGELSWRTAVAGCGVALVFVVLSLWYWRVALRHYTSASS